MTVETKVRKIGNSYGIILTKQVLKELNVSEGDLLYLSKDSDTSVTVAREKPSAEEITAIIKQGMDRYAKTLEKLKQIRRERIYFIDR